MSEEDLKILQNLIDICDENPESQINTFKVLDETGAESGSKIIAVVGEDNSEYLYSHQDIGMKIDYMYQCLVHNENGNLFIGGIEEDAQGLNAIVQLCKNNQDSQIFTIDFQDDNGEYTGERGICVVSEQGEILSPMFKADPLKVDYLFSCISYDENNKLIVTL